MGPRRGSNFCGEAYSNRKRPDQNKTPLLGGNAKSQSVLASDGLGYCTSAALGLLQSLCCPMALVSINFIIFVTTPKQITAFLAVYVAAFIAGNALFAYAWSRFSRGSMFKFVHPKVVFRA